MYTILTSSVVSQSPIQFSRGKVEKTPLLPTLRSSGKDGRAGASMLTAAFKLVDPEVSSDVAKKVGYIVVASVAASIVGDKAAFSVGAEKVGEKVGLQVGVQVGFHVSSDMCCHTQKSLRL